LKELYMEANLDLSSLINNSIHLRIALKNPIEKANTAHLIKEDHKKRPLL